MLGAETKMLALCVQSEIPKRTNQNSWFERNQSNVKLGRNPMARHSAKWQLLIQWHRLSRKHAEMEG
jgi:hypothetical protein